MLYIRLHKISSTMISLGALVYQRLAGVAGVQYSPIGSDMATVAMSIHRDAAMPLIRRIASAVLLLLLTLIVKPTVAMEQGFRGEPPQLDEARWASLQEAIRNSAGPQAKLSGDGSLSGADGEAFDEFGYSVALSGGTALVGVPFDDIGGNTDQGSVYVYIQIAGNWTQQAKLTAGDGAAGDAFGFSVALSGDIAIVGAHRANVGTNDNQGSAYVYTRTGNHWTQQAKLVASDGLANDEFGTSVALSGETALIGAPGDDFVAAVDRGSAYLFSRSGATWSQIAKFLANDGATSDLFGYSVALSGETALIGAYFDDIGPNNDQGSAYVFARSISIWTQQAKLTASDGSANDLFGRSVALSGDTALVGSYLDDVASSGDQGSAYVFARIGSTWSQQAKLTASNGSTGDQFGFSVAISGDSVVVGASADDIASNGDQGSAYLFARAGGVWIEQVQISSDDGIASDSFGASVAVSADTALIGAYLDDIGVNSNQGSAYIFANGQGAWMQQMKLTAGDGASEDSLGVAVAVSGDTALLGAYLDDAGAIVDRGAAYVYVRSGNVWIQQAKLMAADGAANDQFGFAVALDGDIAVVGAPGDDIGADGDRGSAYVYARSGSTWTQQAKLTAEDGDASDFFGSAVGVYGGNVLVGAHADDVGANVDQGSAYVFTQSGSAWAQQAQLTPSDGAATDNFAVSVAISADTAIVGAYADDVASNVDQGSAYVFTLIGNTWIQQAKLAAADGWPDDQFGVSVALSGEVVLVGARRVNIGPNVDQGAAYVFSQGINGWAHQAKLSASDGAASDSFGTSVALSGGVAVVGSYLDDVGANADKGSAYVYTRSGGAWSEQAKIVANDGARDDFFGTSVAVSGTTALVGAPGHDGSPPDANPDEGAAYVYARVDLLDRVFNSGFEPAEILPDAPKRLP